MTLNNIRIFLEVYSTLNITEASKKLHMTQPVISRTIKTLEDEYDSRFFERIGKKLSPTEEGKLFYVKMSKIIHDIDNIKADLKSEQEQKAIRIGAALMIGNYMIPDICRTIKEIYPEINIKVTIAAASELKNKLLSNELDFALVEDSLHEEALRYTPFYNDKMVPIFSTDLPLSSKKTISLREFSKYPFLLREKGSGTRTYIDSLFSSKGLIIEALWESTSTSAIIRGVKENFGVSILPYNFVSEYINKGDIASAKFSDKIPDRTCFIVYHKDKYLPDIYDEIFKNICKMYS